MFESVEITELKNGLKIITDPASHLSCYSLGIYFNVGSREENAKNNGVSHFVEHMVFKGTTTRTKTEINYEVENRGCMQNAFTDQYETAYYIESPVGYIDENVKHLIDLSFNPIFDQNELEKERTVILEEYSMGRDDAYNRLFYFALENFWKNHPVSKKILGTPETISNMHSNDLKQYWSQYYFPSNAIIVASGNISHTQLVESVEKYIYNVPNQNKKEKEYYEPIPHFVGDCFEKTSFDQVSFMSLFKGYKASQIELNHSAYLMAACLGFGSSSRLYQKIREDLGLAYHIYATHDASNEGGFVRIGGGVNAENLKQTLDIIHKECLQLKDNLNEEEVIRTKNMICGYLSRRYQNTLSRMNKIAEDVLCLGYVLDPTTSIEKYRKVTLEEIKEQADIIFDGQTANFAVIPS